MDEPIKRLKRSKSDKKIAGICGGLGNYFEVDPVIIRIAFILIAALSAVIPALIAYIIMWFIVPAE